MSKLIYIIAAGHSGSTLLDMVLGTNPNIFSTGELVHLPWQLSRIGISDPHAPNAGKCSCLRTFPECDTWSSIIERLSSRIGYNVYQDPYKFKLSIFKSQQYRRKERLFIRTARWFVNAELSRLCMMSDNRLYQKIYSNEMKNNWLLIDIINDICHTDFVVDSSKDFIRMRFLHSYRPDDLYLIILTRDIRGIAYSHSLRGIDPLTSAKKAIKLYKSVDRTVKTLDNLRFIVIAYEDLCRNPYEIRKRVNEFLNIQSLDAPFGINTHHYHLVAGNPIRYRGEINIKTDRRWEKGLSLEQQSKIEAMTQTMKNSQGSAL